MDINKDVIKLLFTVRDCHSLVSDMGGGGSNQKMTKCDMGEGGQKSRFSEGRTFCMAPKVPLATNGQLFLTFTRKLSKISNIRNLLGNFQPSKKGENIN